jgi:capsular polysaccharide biosynthesis protein
MEEQNKGVNIKVQDLWQILKGCWIVVLALFIVATSATYIFMNATHEDQYTAKVTLWAIRDSANANGPSSSDVSAGASLTEDYKQLIKSDRIVRQVKENLGMPTSISALKSMASVSEDGRILTLSVTASKKERAQELANEWGAVFCEAINTTVNSGASGDPIVMIKVWETATLPTAPSNPVKPVYALLAGIGAAVLVYVLYLVLFILDDKITGPEDVENYLGLNVLGAIPDKNALRSRRLEK